MALELQSVLCTFENSTKCNEKIVRSRFFFRTAKRSKEAVDLISALGFAILGSVIGAKNPQLHFISTSPSFEHQNKAQAYASVTQ